MPGNFANVEESAATPELAAASFRASRRLRFAKLVTHFPPLLESRSVFCGCKLMQLLPPLEPCKAGTRISRRRVALSTSWWAASRARASRRAATTSRTSTRCTHATASSSSPFVGQLRRTSTATSDGWRCGWQECCRQRLFAHLKFGVAAEVCLEPKANVAFARMDGCLELKLVDS